MREYARAKQAYDDMKEALDSVTRSGYGIVHLKLQQMKLGEPEVFKQGSKYGVRLVASAPCLHIIRTDISTEISPIVGSEQQSADLVNYLMEKFSVSGDEMEIWETNLFGKSLQEMVVEQMDGKLTSMPESLQGKVQRSLQKISNEGKDYFLSVLSCSFRCAARYGRSLWPSRAAPVSCLGRCFFDHLSADKMPVFVELLI